MTSQQVTGYYVPMAIENPDGSITIINVAQTENKLVHDKLHMRVY